MTDKALEQLIDQYNQLVTQYPGLIYGIDKELDCFYVAGVLHFSASFGKYSLQDSYLIRVDVPWNFDLFNVPAAYELSGRIPKAFHHHLNGNLCLGVYIAIYEKLKQDCTLLGYVNNLLVPYLFAYSCYVKYGEMPFGNAGHDKDAMLLYLQDHFPNVPINRFLDFIIYMYMPQVYGSHRPCLCGSGRPLRDCHFTSIKALADIYPKVFMRYDMPEYMKQINDKNVRCDSMISLKDRKDFCRKIKHDLEADRELLAQLNGKEIN